MKTKNVERYLNSFGKKVVSGAKKRLAAAGKGGGKLENSIKFKVMPDLSVQFSMADYGTFVDKGVKGAGGKIPNGKYKGSWGGRRHYTTWEGKRKDSPYKYGTGTGKKGGLSDGIGSFIRKKGLQPRSEGGQFMSTAGLKYLIIRNIWIRGIHGISFFQKPLGIGMQDYGKKFLAALSEDILESLKTK
tara:strand:+ start:2118 stop:2681 length:564 start_codon:yes stop_codon:yes gene_type:complete